MLKIIFNSVTKDVPPPKMLDIVLNTQQKSAERNANGKLMRETLPDKWTINISWDFVNDTASYYDWFKYLSTLTRSNFNVTFPAPTGELLTKEFYISPLSATMFRFQGGSYGTWTDLKCSFIEV